MSIACIKDATLENTGFNYTMSLIPLLGWEFESPNSDQKRLILFEIRRFSLQKVEWKISDPH